MSNPPAPENKLSVFIGSILLSFSHALIAFPNPSGQAGPVLSHPMLSQIEPKVPSVFIIEKRLICFTSSYPIRLFCDFCTIAKLEISATVTAYLRYANQRCCCCIKKLVCYNFKKERYSLYNSCCSVTSFSDLGWSFLKIFSHSKKAHICVFFSTPTFIQLLYNILTFFNRHFKNRLQRFSLSTQNSRPEPKGPGRLFVSVLLWGWGSAQPSALHREAEVGGGHGRLAVAHQQHRLFPAGFPYGLEDHALVQAVQIGGRLV